jgi:lysozyme family protein
MKSSYDFAIKNVLLHEGGYTNEKSDPGGPTNWGITIYDARAYWRPNATANDVRAMPLEVAKKIYREKYWDAVEGDKLPAGVDYAVFDYGVNSGVSRAAKVLQHAVGVQVDGHIGPKTIAATVKTDIPALINVICDERLHFLQGLKIWPVYKNGWSRRVKEVRAAALHMAEVAHGA